jgi:2-C-methyl-D-erythritol 4-phosphate cytidylyltransferase
MKRVSAIIVAAGEGRRFGGAKQDALLAGQTVLERVLDRFNTHPEIADIILVLKDINHTQDYREKFLKISAVTSGGIERQDSVLAGFQALPPDKVDIVLIHDGVRPLVSNTLISRVIKATADKGAVVPVISLEDTIKQVHGDKILSTANRTQLRRVQTPQGFKYHLLQAALEKAQAERYYGTDEASLVERLKKEVGTVPGDRRNIKITTPEDIKYAEALLED